ncbi:MAG: hypothetical protein ACK5LC_04500 [Coprobacillaceae bacterium]
MATKVNKYQSAYNYKQVRKEKKKQPLIPTFGYKSAIIIALTASLTAIFLPLFGGTMGLDTTLITLIANSLCIPLAVCYCQYYLETNRGFTKSCIKVYILLAIGIAVISYFWLYIGLYM